ncbi:MAG: hypothetical protein WBX25_11145 [Rhodomicrobium sp.]
MKAIDKAVKNWRDEAYAEFARAGCDLDAMDWNHAVAIWRETLTPEEQTIVSETGDQFWAGIFFAVLTELKLKQEPALSVH